jgi:hypothetical protein
MKKILMMLAAATAFSAAQAQRSNVESAAIYLRSSEMADAKKVIDEAAVHEETKNDPKMWYYRTAIYDTILRNKDYSALVDGNTVEQFVLAAKGCVATDEKKRYEWYCVSSAIVQSSFDAYAKAFDYLQNKDYPNATKYFEYIISNIPLDKDGALKKNNLNEKAIYDAIYRSAYVDGKFDIARKYSQKLIDLDYNNSLVYYFNAETHMMAGDTATGLAVVAKGRSRFPQDKDLINYELNIYLKQGKQDILLDKVNEALAMDAENATLVYVRGNIYDRYAAELITNGRKAKSDAEKLQKKAKSEKVPATKAKYESQAKKLMVLSDSLMKDMRVKVALAEVDYKKTIELTPENIDGHYAMGALLNNYENTELVEQMNNVNGATQAEYDKKYNPLRKKQVELLGRAMKYFEEALTIVDGMPEGDENAKSYKLSQRILVLESIKSVYANLNNEAKFMEIQKQINVLKGK